MTSEMNCDMALKSLKSELDNYLKANFQEFSSSDAVVLSKGAGTQLFAEKADLTPRQERDLCELLNELGDSFHGRLFALIAGSGLTDAEVYRRADLDRKLFSKILALKLSIEDAADLLSRAGYAFSPGNKGDLIVKFFIEHGIYDIDAVKYTLEEYGQTLS